MATPESILSMLASVIVIFVTLITNKKIFTISETDKIDIVIGDERKSLKSFIYKNPYLILHYIVLLLLCFGSYTRIKVMNDLLSIPNPPLKEAFFEFFIVLLSLFTILFLYIFEFISRRYDRRRLEKLQKQFNEKKNLKV